MHHSSDIDQRILKGKEQKNGRCQHSKIALNRKREKERLKKNP